MTFSRYKKSKSKSKQKQTKIGAIDFLISFNILKAFLVLSATFSEMILLGPESCVIKFKIHLMFKFVGLRLICLDINFLPSQKFQLISDGNFNDF